MTMTIIGLAVSGVIFAAATLMLYLPTAPGKVRLVPYGAIQFVALVGVLIFGAHLISLLTGSPLKGRLMR